jgi:hypothetical protein
MAEFAEAAHAEKLFSWPTPQDYNEAVQSPAFCFNDPELKSGVTELNEFGLPRPISGGFASVYHVRKEAREFAVRCFLSRVSNLQFRYEAIMAELHEHPAPWAVPCEFIPQGMLVGTTWFPVLKMEWIKGDTLGAWIEKYVQDADKLQGLRARFRELVFGLKQQGVAHGDLQPANILVMADDTLRLVDYDGMFVPSLAGTRASELGHKNFQHPERNAENFDGDLDHFAAWLIDTALQILLLDPALWDQLNCGDDALLFRSADLNDPDHSYTFSVLEAHQDPEVVRLARLVRTLARGPLHAVPALDVDMAPDDSLPAVEYTPPVLSDDVASFQKVPREIHRPKRRQRRATKIGGGAMAAIPAHIAAGLVLDSARNRRIIIYPTMVIAALIVVGTVTVRLLSADSYNVNTWLSRLSQPRGVSLFQMAHEDYDNNNLSSATTKFNEIINRFDEPNFGLKEEDLIEAYVHRSEMEHSIGQNQQAKAGYRKAEQLARELRVKEPGRDEPYEQDYFIEQELICDMDNIDPSALADRLIGLFKSNSETARWTPWDLGRVFGLVARTDMPKAVEYWNAWSSAIDEGGFDYRLRQDINNLGFATVVPYASSQSTAERQKARMVYQMIYETAARNPGVTRNDELDALAGLYYLAHADKNLKEEAKIINQLKAVNAASTTEDLEEYAGSPPTRDYNPERYHSS